VDIAVLGIEVKTDGVAKAITSLDGMAVAGAKAEKSTEFVTRRMALAEIAARNMDAAITRNSSAFGRLQSAMAGLDHVMPGLTTAMKTLGSFAVVGFIGHETVEHTIEAQNAMAQLEAAVKSTGGAAGRTVDQLDELSMELQKQTAYSHIAVQGAEAMLLTFDKIRGVNFDRAVRDVTDLAARMGGDLQGAAVQVGKALQDPEHGLAALRKSGVSFSDSQIALIKSLYDAGQAAEGQRVIMGALEHQYGGSAAAARDTLAGALEGLKNAWGDLFELTRGGSQGAVNAINAMTHALEEHGLTMNTILADAVVDWETMKTSIAKVAAIMALPIDKNFLQEARNIIHQLDEELIHFTIKQSRAAKTGPAAGLGGRGHDEESAGAKKQREQNEDMVRQAKQALEIAGLEGRAQEMARIGYEETNKAIKAQRELKGDLLDETLKAIHVVADYQRQAVTVTADKRFAKDLQEIWQKGVSDVIRATHEGIGSMLSSVGSLFHDMLVRMQREGQSNPRLEYAMAAISGGLAGFDTGQSLYSSSHGALGNYARGAIGGAASGAMAGAMIGTSILPVIGTAAGAVTGAVAGLVGGILGIGSASHQAAKAMAEAQAAIRLSLDALRARADNDPLAAGIAQINAEREQLRKAIEDAYSGGGSGSEQVRRRNAALAEMNANEDKLVAQLREAIALQKQQSADDLRVRTLRNEGQGHEADILAKQLADQREYAQAVKDKMDDAYLSQLKYNQGLEEAAVASGKAADAIGALAQGLNMVAGYKSTLQQVMFNAMAPGPALMRAPIAMPSGGSSSTPMAGGGDVTVNMVVDGKVVSKAVLRNFKDQAQRMFGEATRWSEIS
jgi:hypothetical protein